MCSAGSGAGSAAAAPASGLYIVKGLVEAHGGTIGVRSAPGGRRRIPIYRARGDRRGLSAAAQ